MIRETVLTEDVSYTIYYLVQEDEEKNEVYLVLNSLQYQCNYNCCKASTHVDLSLVPAHNISLFCIQCGHIICDIPEEEFKKRLIPEGELYYA